MHSIATSTSVGLRCKLPVAQAHRKSIYATTSQTAQFFGRPSVTAASAFPSTRESRNHCMHMQAMYLYVHFTAASIQCCGYGSACTFKPLPVFHPQIYRKHKILRVPLKQAGAKPKAKGQKFQAFRVPLTGLVRPLSSTSSTVQPHVPRPTAPLRRTNASREHRGPVVPPKIGTQHLAEDDDLVSDSLSARRLVGVGLWLAGRWPSVRRATRA